MKLEFIKDKVKQACPELLELSFGCEMIDRKQPLDWARHLKLVVCGNDGKIICKEDDGSVYSAKRNIKDFEILGHPITISHILKTIGGVSITDKRLVSFIYTVWNLTKPLDEQSEEVINFLYDILK